MGILRRQIMKRAQILYGFVHWIFEAEEYPDPPWPPDQEGNPIVIIDLTGGNENAQEGDGYNPETGMTVHRPEVEWDSDNYEFTVS
jgi:hypothetical protein